MVESANVIGTRSVSAFSVAMPQRLAFNRCTEKYLFRVYLDSLNKVIPGLVFGVIARPPRTRRLGALDCQKRLDRRTNRHDREPQCRAKTVRPRPVADAAGSGIAAWSCDVPARSRRRG